MASGEGNLDAEILLHQCLHEYMKKKNLFKSAAVFKYETKLKDHPLANKDSGKGLLHEWWCFFWDVFVKTHYKSNHMDTPGEILQIMQSHISTQPQLGTQGQTSGSSSGPPGDFPSTFTAPAISAGPASPSTWVLEAKEATPTPFPAPIQVSIPVPDPAPVYTVPSPSATLQPEDAAWYQNRVPATVAGPVVRQRQMTSSEWLWHYHQTQQAAAAPAVQSPLLSPNYYYYSNSRMGDAAGVETPPPLDTVLPQDYTVEMQRREAAAAPAVVELQAQRLLQYLKERERQLQGLYDPNASG